MTPTEDIQWWCAECKAFIAPEQVKQREGAVRHFPHEPSFTDLVPTHLLHVVTNDNSQFPLSAGSQTDAAAACTGPFRDAFDCPVHDPRKRTSVETTTPAPEDNAAEEAAHDALMLRLIDAVYIQAITSAKLASLPPQFVPRTLVCAAVYGLERLLELYERRQNDPSFGRREAAELMARIHDDMHELQGALTEAADTLGELRAAFTVPHSDLIS